jgi:hypothetical protein
MIGHCWTTLSRPRRTGEDQPPDEAYQKNRSTLEDGRLSSP